MISRQLRHKLRCLQRRCLQRRCLLLEESSWWYSELLLTLMLGRRVLLLHLVKAIDSVASLEKGTSSVKLVVFLQQLAEWFTLILGAIASFDCI